MGGVEEDSLGEEDDNSPGEEETSGGGDDLEGNAKKAEVMDIM